MSNVSGSSRDLFDIITNKAYSFGFDGNITLPIIELLLKAGADFNFPFYDGRQDEWTALGDLVHYQCGGHGKTNNWVAWVDWHECMCQILQLFLQYRGFEAFSEDELDGKKWMYECHTCEEIVHRVILKPLRVQKWLNFCASDLVVRLRHESLLFDKHLLYLIRDFFDG